jgi:hypothetical protein
MVRRLPHVWTQLMDELLKQNMRSTLYRPPGPTRPTLPSISKPSGSNHAPSHKTALTILSSQTFFMNDLELLPAEITQYIFCDLGWTTCKSLSTTSRRLRLEQDWPGQGLESGLYKCTLRGNHLWKDGISDTHISSLTNKGGRRLINHLLLTKSDSILSTASIP